MDEVDASKQSHRKAFPLMGKVSAKLTDEVESTVPPLLALPLGELSSRNETERVSPVKAPSDDGRDALRKHAGDMFLAKAGSNL